MGGSKGVQSSMSVTRKLACSLCISVFFLLNLFWLEDSARPGEAAAQPAQKAAPAQRAPQAAPQATQAAPVQNMQQQRIQPEAAFALMAGEAEKGSAAAMLTLGQFYEQGVGIARNYSKALEWYEKAAKAGQAEGFYNLGVCYEIGMGAAADAAKALQNFQRAADMGLPIAMNKLASMFISGNGAARDTAKGISWLDKAANAGVAAAANDLGAIHLAGLLGQKKDEKKALSMFMKAADLGNLEAIRNVAAMHKDGIGTRADPALAYLWYSIARRGGYTGEDVVRMLGLLEGSLSTAQVQQAQKDADAWIENFAKRQAGRQ